MKLARIFRKALLALFILPTMVLADSDNGFVRIPLAEYQRLVNQAEGRRFSPGEGYALGKASFTVSVTETDKKPRAKVALVVPVTVLEDRWTVIPLLPPGVAVSSATVNGQAASLISDGGGIAYSTKNSGTQQIALEFFVDAEKWQDGYLISVPTPQAGAMSVSASLPTGANNPTIVPSSGMTAETSGNGVRVSGTVAGGRGFQITWRSAAEEGYSLSRADYKGFFEKDTLRVSASFEAEVNSSAPVTLKLLPKTTALAEVKVDEASAPLIVDGERFATIVKGSGRHKVFVDFQIPVPPGSASPGAAIDIPQIPISRFELNLPGKKDIQVSPSATVTKRDEKDRTIAVIFLPMTDQVTFNWTEAIPEEEKVEARPIVEVFHTVIAEEGVLSVDARANYEINRGRMSSFELQVPKDVQINKISSNDLQIADWRVAAGEGEKPGVLTVFLEQEVNGNVSFDIAYDRSLLGDQGKEFQVPLLIPLKTYRQRGMAALLQSKELTLKPAVEESLTRVGENQLPPEIRQRITKTVAHTYKYVEQTPKLTAQAVKPEKSVGKYDSTANTLLSLSDVTLRGSTSVEVSVKSGAIDSLEILLPDGLNVLGLTGPSIRTHKVTSKDGKQLVEVQFTQDMDGQFKLDLNYERILNEKESEVQSPLVQIKGAEVEQGRIAVEALSAVEIQPASAARLSSLDPSELPQQLVLKTTNPILLAYKYVQTDPAYDLRLKITRHRQLDLQSATIDDASYKTLFTKDGTAVTSAIFMVRNNRQQFLKLHLPKNSEVWSVFVDGKLEKPALAEEGKSDVLIKIVSSSQPFPVQVVYRTPLSKIRFAGFVGMVLPRPDMVTAKTSWSAYVPDDVSYGTPSTNMTVVSAQPVTAYAIQSQFKQDLQTAGRSEVQPLQLQVPQAGILFRFEKLYANQGDEDSYFRLFYTEGFGRVGAAALLGAAVLAVLWAAYLGVLSRGLRQTPALITGVIVLILFLGVLGFGAGFAAAVAIIAVFVPVLRSALSYHRRKGEQSSIAPAE